MMYRISFSDESVGDEHKYPVDAKYDTWEHCLDALFLAFPGQEIDWNRPRNRADIASFIITNESEAEVAKVYHDYK